LTIPFFALRHDQNTPAETSAENIHALPGGLPFAAVASGGSTLSAFLELAGGAEIGSETTLRAAPFGS
jgi:hypothetical protein